MERTRTDVSFSWIQDSDQQIPPRTKVKRKVKHKKMEFVGWGSKPLIYFLESNGKDCSQQLSQYEVATIIKEYMNRHNLICHDKKNRFVCDEWLYSLFGKKTVLRMNVQKLLEEHFAENHHSSEDDLLSSSDEDEAFRSSSKKRKILYEKKQVMETPKSRFAKIVPENIKLLYLKRSLVQELLKDTESFEVKVVGSYVRIKSDPNDYSQRHSHQLLPVTGVISERRDVGEEILLQVPNAMKAIPIRLLSEDNFSEEECEDLSKRVKDGLISRPTVVEFEQNARSLHEDITKHWLEKELSLLRNLMDRANEKGWRREYFTKFEYLERIQLLETPVEKARLLLEVPKVIADDLERDPTLQEPIENVEQEISASPTLIADEKEPGPTFQAPINSAKQGITSSPTSIIRDTSISSADSGANQPISSIYPDAKGSVVAAVPSQDNTYKFPVERRSKVTSVNGITSTKGSNGSIVGAVLSQDNTNELPVDRKSKVTSVNGITPTKDSNAFLAAYERYKLQNIMEVKSARVVQQQNGLFMSTRNEKSKGMQVPWCGGNNAFETYELQKITEAKPASVFQQPNGLFVPTMNENTNGKQVAWRGGTNAFEKDEPQKIIEAKPASVFQQPNGLFVPTMNENTNGKQVAWRGGTNAFEKDEPQKIIEAKPASVFQQPNGLFMQTMNENTNGKQVAWRGGTNAFEKVELQKIIEVVPPSAVQQQNRLSMPKMNENSIGMQVPWYGGTNAFATCEAQKIMEFKPASILQHRNGLFRPTMNENSIGMQVPWYGGTNNSRKVEEKKVPQVIELSDDEHEYEDKGIIKEEGFQFRILENRESKIWYYMDPQGRVQGPVTMIDLKTWYDAQYFMPDFKVWKRDQNPGQAVLLTDLLRQMF